MMRESNGHLNIEQRLLTVDETGKYLSLHPKTIYLMARKGDLPVVRIGRAVRFDKVQLDRWIEKSLESFRLEAV